MISTKYLTNDNEDIIDINQKLKEVVGNIEAQE
jgi:hypothetical protein